MRRTVIIQVNLDSSQKEALQEKQSFDLMCIYGIGRKQDAVWKGQ